ncbi:Long chain fatty acyl-CoA synthetase [Wickerhamomyces ciferrii]|uniref:Long chain fatty acyl-CoA synthetase n=1 Tax=Wickerhamomyces ciferrii (strain ATCC 14091 / BCRC 22168 / CBS 111 / JCM 3599 / NBRC 0793 / NRRL Y-1031 F-60-10) TaxID=1206466 RepID=K0KR25_WICCF|nr:Long chain fatty acyl-CoA synthetase [Wickerhamomyces ciferrii]CCH44557.1 Long chain fatty acyl-CoA synthetase [Wickerhamomyces ciferrii]
MFLTKEDSLEILRVCNSLHKKYPQEKKFRSVAIPGTQEAGFSPIYRNEASTDELINLVHPKLQTFHDFFQHSLNLYGDEYCYGYRPIVDGEAQDYFHYLTYKEVEIRKDNFASGLINLVFNHPNFDKNDKEFYYEDGKPNFMVSLFSGNRIEWKLTDMATSDYSLPNTALYDTLGPDASRYILELTKSPVVVLSKDKISKILKLKKEFGLKNLHILISMDELTFENDFGLIQYSDSLGIQLIDFSKVETLGEINQLPKDFNLPKPSTIYTISFTSGTTGPPKGVLIDHRIAISGITATFIHFKKPINNIDEETYYNFASNIDNNGKQIRALSYLPLAHIYERMLINWATFRGFAIAFPSKPGTASLFEDLRVLQPHYFTGVPRVYSRIETSIKAHISSLNPIGKKAFELSMTSNTWYNILVGQLSKLKEQLGFQNVHYCTSASAPMSPHSIKFLKDSLHIGFENSYGLTESFAVMSCDDPFGDAYMGNVGPPCVSTEMRLKDVEAMGYSASDDPPRGELQLRGPQIYLGYYKNTKSTKEVLGEDGWFSTGDIATFDSNGRIIVIDRVKNFFKLSQGEYITPEKVENTYLTSNQLLTQMFVHGDSMKNYLVGVAGVEPESFKKFLKENLDVEVIDNNHLRVHLEDPRVRKSILALLNTNAMNKGVLQGFEKLHNLYLDIEPLKVEDEVLTPTFKLKRVQAVRKFKQVLDNLYHEGSLVDSVGKL